MKLLVTGGHISPALACIDEISKKEDLEIVFVGRKHNNEREKTTSMEFAEITSRNIKFINLTAGRVTRLLNLRSFLNWFNFPIGFFQSLIVLKKEKPDAILTFGGYIALPIAIVGNFLGIPVYIHEQTVHPGSTNRVLGNVAKKIFLAFDEAKKYFPPQKVIVVGNPIRKQVFEIINKPFSIDEKLPVIYVTGGSLGSHSVSMLIEPIIMKLLEKYIVIHQAGNVAQYNDFSRLTEMRINLPEKLQKRYFLRSHFQTHEIGYIYSQADLVIGRSGANTFSELVSLKKPSILIPLPWSANGEQQKQAEILKNSGAAEIFDQSGKSSDLLILIEKMIKDLEKYRQSFNNLNSLYSRNAAEQITAEIYKNQ